MKNCILSICLFLLGLSASAQDFTVNGTVKDDKGQPVIGAVVMVEGNQSKGAVTDINGTYVLSGVSPKDILNFSCIGYKTASMAIEGRRTVDAVMAEDSKLLDEAVVIGYGAMKRSDLTGSVTSVRVDEENASRSTSVDQLLQGRAAGVQVISNSSSPDAGVSIRIRGLSSFNGGSEPLYVVDGVIINASSNSESLISDLTTEESNGLLGINPQDIASMEILKDASATAIYGSQGANGVVLITTKNAKKDRTTVSFNAGITIGRVNKHMDMLDFDEFVNYIMDIGRNDVAAKIYENPSTREGLKVIPTDWQDYTLRTSVSQRYFLSVSGRPGNTVYRLSMGYSDKQGLIRNTGVKQLTMRLNLDWNINKNLKIGTKTNVAWIKSQMTQGANASSISSGNSMTRSMLTYHPYATEDELSEDPDDDDEINYTTGPDRWLKYFTNNRTQVKFTPSLYLEWKIVPWLTFKTSAGADYQSLSYDKFRGIQISRVNGSTGAVSLGDSFRVNWYNMFMVDKRFGGHNISGTIGSTTTYSTKGTQTVQAWYIEQDASQSASLNGSVSPYNSLSYSETTNAIQSFLARAVYNYRDRYVLTATIRTDGSSRFQGKNKWATFPSFAAAWRMSEENWFRSRAVSMVKFRLGWGRVGNQAIPAYRTLPIFTTSTISDHSPYNETGYLRGTYLSYISNPDLKWETTEQVNGGVDLGFFKGRLTLSADVYYKMTKDLLQSKNISRTSGYSSMWVNQGDVSNRGVELTIEGVPVKTKDIEWTLGGNISFNQNKITNIGADIQTQEIYLSEGNKQVCNFFWGSMMRSSTATTSVLNIFVEGQPMGMFYGFKTLGVVKEGEDWPGIGSSSADRAKPGDVKYVDINGNGYIDDDDRTLIGNPNPLFTFGFNTSFTWKNLSISADFNGSYGNKIYNNNLYVDLNTLPTSTVVVNVKRTAYIDAWSPKNPDGTQPRLQYDDQYISDRYIEDGSFLRMSNLSLSYRIPIKKKNFFLRAMSLGASVGNVFVLTKYSQWDPEVNSYGSDITRMGVDSGSYPGQRSYSFDLKFTF